MTRRIVSLLTASVLVGLATAPGQAEEPYGQVYLIEYGSWTCELRIDEAMGFEMGCTPDRGRSGGVIEHEGFEYIIRPTPDDETGLYIFGEENYCEDWPEIAVGETSQDVCWIDASKRARTLVTRTR